MQDRDPFVQAAKRTPVDLRAWAVGLMERDNRKSHLAPQLSPSTQELLRSNDSPTPKNTEHNPDYTPTSGEIPIGGAINSPRDQFPHLGARSPTRNGHSGHAVHGSLSRPAGPAAVHPGMGQRSATAGSIPKVGGTDLTSTTPNAPTFALPMRPAPPGGPLPPPPPRKSTPDDMRRDNRRQVYLPSTNGGYAGMGYPPQ
jgi:mitogen-activated protein kinase kinase